MAESTVQRHIVGVILTLELENQPTYLTICQPVKHFIFASFTLSEILF